jgi:hypothetical protein
MTRRAFCAFFFIGGATFPIGCGAGSNASIPTPTPSPEPAARVVGSWFRTLKPGDYWNWQGSIETYNPIGSTETLTLNGSSSLQKDGGLVKAQINLATSKWNTIAYEWYQQNPDSQSVDVNASEIDGVKKLVGGLKYPGYWAEGIDILGSGSRFQVVAKEIVTVPLGRFETWKVTLTQNNSNFKLDGTYWYVPDLGNWIRAQWTYTDKKDNVVRNYFQEMTTTNTL